jgi:hypothetical protein
LADHLSWLAANLGPLVSYRVVERQPEPESEQPQPPVPAVEAAPEPTQAIPPVMDPEPPAAAQPDAPDQPRRTPAPMAAATTPQPPPAATQATASPLVPFWLREPDLPPVPPWTPPFWMVERTDSRPPIGILVFNRLTNACLQNGTTCHPPRR